MKSRQLAAGIAAAAALAVLAGPTDLDHQIIFRGNDPAAGYEGVGCQWSQSHIINCDRIFLGSHPVRSAP